MNEQPKKIYTLEDNIKSIFFQNKDILKALQEVKELLESKKSKDSNDWIP